jgi:hypothetical protein
MSKVNSTTTGNAAETLNRCLQAIESGQATVESCIAAHPDFVELRQLLGAANVVQELPRPLLPQAHKLALRSQALSSYRASNTSRKRSAVSRMSLRLMPRWAVGALAASLVVVLLFVGGTGLVRASEEALPGDQLYGLKRLNEQIQMSFAETSARPAVIYNIAKTRLAEVHRLTERKLPINDALLTDLTQDVNMALAVQPDAVQRASLVGDVAMTMDQAQASGAITAETRLRTLGLLVQTPLALTTPSPGDSPTPEPAATSAPWQAQAGVAPVQVASPSPALTATATPTEAITPTEDSALPTEAATEDMMLTAVPDLPDSGVQSQPTQRPAPIKPQPTRSNRGQGNGNANGNGNGNANGNGNGNGGKK